jgi:hypothetical protein
VTEHQFRLTEVSHQDGAQRGQGGEGQTQAVQEAASGGLGAVRAQALEADESRAEDCKKKELFSGFWRFFRLLRIALKSRSCEKSDASGERPPESEM